MRKLFLLIPVLLIALTIMAADQYPDPSVSNSLADAVINVGDGETIWLDDATPYVNHYASQGGDDYTKLRSGKNITIRAISGKHPVIKYEVPFLVREAVNAKFIGVKFDGSSLDSHYDYYFLFYDDADNSLEFEDCEFTNIGKYMVYVPEGKKAASCIFKNCNIHDNTQRIFYNYKATVNRLEINNTEISNSSHYIVHNNQAQMDSCIIVNSNIHNNSSRCILNEGTIDGLKLNGSVFTYFPSHSIVDNYTNGVIGSIKIEGCEFANNSKTVVNGEAASRAGECIINNCYFHDNIGCAIYFRKSSVASQQTCSDLRITNSTFNNIDVSADYYSVIDIRPDVTDMTDAIKVIVDHCTFYNLTTISHDYSAIRPYKLSDVTITNCIFAHPTAEVDVNEGPQNARRATCCYGGTISNCLTWNLMEDASRNAHRQDGGQPVLTNNFTADPLFAHAANGDFSFANNNWVTPSLSPACGAATDGTDLGDPRWYSNGTLPETNFATAYECTGEKAQILGNIWKDANNYLYGDGGNNYDKGSNSAYGLATWRIHATAATALKATLDMDPDATASGHIFKVEIFDEKGVKMGEVEENGYSNSNTSTPLNGCIYLPKAGNYSVRLSNTQTYSSAKIKGLILAHEGGAIQNIPATLDVSEAWYSAKGSRADNKISFTSYTDSWVKWNIAVPGTGEKGYAVTLTYSLMEEYGHEFYVSVYEEGDEEHAQTIGEGDWHNDFDAVNPIVLPLGNIAVQGGKNYVVKLINTAGGSKPKIISLGFTSLGGAVQNMPGTTNIDQAWFIGGTRTAGTKITFTEGHVNEGWAKWNVSFANDANYNVKLNVNSGNGKKFTVALLDADGNDAVTPLYLNGGATGSPVTLEMGAMTVPAGNYILKVSNAEAYSDAQLISVQFVQAGGGLVDLPTTDDPLDITFDEVILSPLAFVNGNGEIQFTDETEENGSKVPNQFAKWRIHAGKEGCYKFATHVKSANAQSYTVSIYNSDETVLKGTKSLPEEGNWGHERTFMTDTIYLTEGDYILKVQNKKTYSQGRILGIAATYMRGTRQNVPGQILGEDAMICKEEGSTHDIKMSHLANGDLQYDDNGHNMEEYAMWNIHVDAAAEMTVTLNVATSGHIFSLELYQGDNRLDSIGELWEDENTKTTWDDGDITLPERLTFPAAGNYTLKLLNNQAHSGGALHGITFAEYIPLTAVTINEMATDNAAWINYYNTDELLDVTLNRTLKANMYNTFCVPFKVTSDMGKAVFGEDVQIYTLESAVVDGAVLNITLSEPGTGIYQGTPVFIKPSHEIVNPVFNGVKILVDHAASTTRTNADLVGTFVQTTLTQGSNILYLGPDNMLYYPDQDTPIKGMRCWFAIHDTPTPVPAIRRMNIVERGDVITDINYVETGKDVLKTIENGQIVIIRDGVRYNVMGVKLQ